MKNNFFTVANFFSFLRILLTPLFIYLLFTQKPYFEILALIVFIVASVTDAYDGYFARKYNTISSFGIFLDPLADKILMSAAFLSFVVMKLVPLWMVIVIIFRDFMITGLRIYFNSKNKSMETRKSAKIKTGAQIGVVCFILVYLITQRWPLLAFMQKPVHYYLVENFPGIYCIMLIVTLFTAWTGIEYLIVNRNVIFAKK
ncbi:MAG: CDP-diacylglycerol--glycerol-3-phosphate 3-phosphatidyltransferase [Candidatus Marinimicrobia bacterium]|nr:CDP-diacylglycerol--glycerol-3-phosphate 3-phosphatidyltransferase [Candidatus Neomarinimicrobiota bacterium]